jgi:RNA polymerase sigma factor for flagellar operon FliA
MNEKEQLVIQLYYFEELTLKEISEILEVSESRISQIHSNAIRKIRKKLNG